LIQTLLIANRGEIARRIIRTCRRMGLRAVAIYSDTDARALFVEEADEAYRVGPAPAAGSYLNIPAILDAARRARTDAIHPGYGFLAENAGFARTCEAAGITFIGPPAEAIAAMGDKRAARDMAARLGVPVLPGFDGGDQRDVTFVSAAEVLGYPLMVKAAAGGGGKGMRLVGGPAELPEALAAARREASAAFGVGDLLLERALVRPRHIEIQILGDQHGHTVHLGERECSIQRRHQKVIEESPSPAMTPELRAAMGAAAVSLAAAIGYTGAGTVEFLVEDGQFYFLEMNTRLQVEHPVTELVTGLDLVEWQIRVAQGEALPWPQEDIALRGHAIEARLYAEDPANDFLPATGRVLLWRPPAGEGIRVDGGIRTANEITTDYDPLLAKIIARGDTRAEAIRRLHGALEGTALLGLRTNLSYLAQILNQPAFLSGETTTSFLVEHESEAEIPADERVLALVAAALARYLTDAGDGPGYWRNNPGMPAPYPFESGSESVDVYLKPERWTPGRFAATLSSGEGVTVALEHFDGVEMLLGIDGARKSFLLAAQGDTWWIRTRLSSISVLARPLLPEPHRPADAGGSLRAPMPGRVLAVLVEVGQLVEEGQPLMKLEAMKMEHTIRTAAAGVVEAVFYAAGDQVAADEMLVRIVES
jgi:acetyl-CoA carboxylase biotin carboxylase subunit